MISKKKLFQVFSLPRNIRYVLMSSVDQPEKRKLRLIIACLLVYVFSGCVFFVCFILKDTRSLFRIGVLSHANHNRNWTLNSSLPSTTTA